MTPSMSISTTDTYYMTLAIAEAKKGIYSTRPNPSVGCVLVNGLVNNVVKNDEMSAKISDKIIGQGYTSPAGGNHGEINALANATELGNSEMIQGATAYVTLEPCSHYGRTPPCANALIQAGIARVVIAGLDPNPQVAGRGVAMLQQAGIEVVTFAEDNHIQGNHIHRQAEAINKGFLKAMRTGLPYVRLKIATSLDGRTAMSSGESKWITGAESREDVQHYRALSGAIITGSQTVIADNPSLNVRSTRLGVPLELIPQPIPVILDRRGQILPLFQGGLPNQNQTEFILSKREELIIWQEDNLQKLLRTLEQDHQCHDVLVEAGAKVAGAFIKAGLVDELIVYQAPCLLGTDSRPMLDFSISQLAEQHRFQLVSHERMGEDLKLVFAV